MTELKGVAVDIPEDSLSNIKIEFYFTDQDYPIRLLCPKNHKNIGALLELAIILEKMNIVVSQKVPIIDGNTILKYFIDYSSKLKMKESSDYLLKHSI